MGVPVSTGQPKMTFVPRISTPVISGAAGGAQLIQSNTPTNVMMTNRSDSAWHDVGVIKAPKFSVSMYSAHTNDAGINVEVSADDLCECKEFSEMTPPVAIFTF